MDPISATLVIKALDGLSTRQQVTAHNIANASTPGYRPLRVTFETALARAAASGDVADVRAQVEPDPAFAGVSDGLRLDLELANSAQTASRYAALVDVLSRQLQLQSLAVTGGR